MNQLLQSTSRPEQAPIPLDYERPLEGSWAGSQPTEQQEHLVEQAPSSEVTRWFTSGYSVLPDLTVLGTELVVVELKQYAEPTLAQYVQTLNFEQRSGQADLLIINLPPREEFGRERHPNPALRELDEIYVFEDRPHVASFIEQNRLRELLLQAQGPLNAAFGETAVKRLLLIEDEEGSQALICLISATGDVGKAREKLRSFDESWWLLHCDEVRGKLNFDYDLI